MKLNRDGRAIDLEVQCAAGILMEGSEVHVAQCSQNNVGIAGNSRQMPEVSEFFLIQEKSILRYLTG